MPAPNTAEEDAKAPPPAPARVPAGRDGGGGGDTRRPPDGARSASMAEKLLQCFCVVGIATGTFYTCGYPLLVGDPPAGDGDSSALKWWQSSVIYQVYPRSFQDSDGDGVGDLKGIQSRLSYFEYLGVEAIWLSPVYTSPMVDFGYDVANFTDIDPVFGTLQDFDDLIGAAHEKGIRIIMDYIPNHTSDKHEWFLESRKGGATNQYSDYYVWSKGKRLANNTYGPPNNWVTVFDGSMWTWDDVRQEFYLHQFTKEQPDLNYRNQAVRQEMLEVLQFWVDRGVDGFRADAVRHLLESEDLSRDEPRSHLTETNPENYDYWSHPYTTNLPEIHDVFRAWRTLFDRHTERNGSEIFLVLEVAGSAAIQVPYYHSGANFPFNFNLQQLNRSCDGRCMRSLVDEWMRYLPSGKWLNWVLGSHDVNRVSHKMGDNMVDSLNMVLLLLPGTPTTYYGEELGMKDLSITYEETQDPFGRTRGPAHYHEVSRDPERSPMQWNAEQYAGFTSGVKPWLPAHYHEVSRDPERSPMQWNAEQYAGFTSGVKPWLPVHPDFRSLNVEVQSHDASGHSSLQLYRKLVALRKLPAFSSGSFEYALVNENIFSFVRTSRLRHDHPAYLVAINVGGEVSRDNYYLTSGDGFPPHNVSIPQQGRAVFCTQMSSALSENSVVLFENVTLHPGEGVVIKFFSNQL